MLNQKLSEELKAKYPQYSAPKQCYRNVYGLCIMPEFNLSDIRIVFCYLPVDTDHLYFRHVVLKYNNQYIDTVLDIPEKYENMILIKEFNFQEYMNAVVSEGSFELNTILYPLEQKLIEQYSLEIVS